MTPRARVQEVCGHHSQTYDPIFDGPVRSQELDLMNFMSPIQLGIFNDSIILIFYYFL